MDFLDIFSAHNERLAMKYLMSTEIFSCEEAALEVKMLLCLSVCVCVSVCPQN